MTPGVKQAAERLPIHLSLGGPNYTISVRGKPVLFELHPYCGPHPVHKRTLDPLEHIPPGFWDAIELWEKGGKRLTDGVCVVPEKCRECDWGDKIEHLGGRHWEVVGKCDVCEGKGWHWPLTEKDHP